MFLYDAPGGVLFKVYIVGETIKVVRRFSLPDVTKRELVKNVGIVRFPRVSCAAASADEADLDPRVAGPLQFLLCFHKLMFAYSLYESLFLLVIAELPPRLLLEKLARELRRRLASFFFLTFNKINTSFLIIRTVY